MTWPGPDLRAGTTFQLITDTHFGAAGNASWLYSWMDRVATDIVDLGSCHGRVDTGDCIHWDQASDQPMEDAWYVAWRNRITADGKPFALCAGNHDLDSFQASEPLANRTATQWARDVAWQPPGPQNATDIGGVRVLCFSPDRATQEEDGWFLSDATMSWLDQQCAASDRPVLLADHCPPRMQYGSGGSLTNYYQIDVANPTFPDLVGAHDSIVGLLTGHIHVNIDTSWNNHFRTLDMGGRTIFSVNGPPCGGGRYSSVAYADHQWQGVAQTMYLTISDDGRTLTARWRDHLRRQWTTAGAYSSRTITLP